MIYRNFIHALLNCALKSFNLNVPLSGRKRKWWWDNDLKEAKALSLSSYIAWKNSGFPLNSAIFFNYHNNKKVYKNMVHLKKREASWSLSNKLLSSLTGGNTSNFWHQWSANLKTNAGESKFKFSGVSKASDIANLLAVSDGSNCSPNNLDANDKF